MHSPIALIYRTALRASLHFELIGEKSAYRGSKWNWYRVSDLTSNRNFGPHKSMLISKALQKRRFVMRNRSIR